MAAPPPIEIIEGDRLGTVEYRQLRADAGWSDVRAADAELAQALARSWNVCARGPRGELVGMGRLIEDGAVYASLWDMIVRADHRRQGIGGSILGALMRRAGERDLVSLVATRLGEPLYRRAGFSERSRGSTALVWRRL